MIKHQLLINACSEETHLYLIANNDTLLCYKHYVNNKDLSFKLTEYINQLLSDNNIAIKDINDIYLVAGPGKFSAMRICSIVCKTWAFINGTKLHIIDKFKFFSTEDCLCIINSDAGKSYIASYENSIQTSPPTLVTSETLKEIIDKNRHLELVYESDNKKLLFKKLKEFNLVDDCFELEYLKPAC